jgi:hypothetical protein
MSHAFGWSWLIFDIERPPWMNTCIYIYTYIYISLSQETWKVLGLDAGRWRRLAWVVPIRPRWQVGKTVWRFLGTIKIDFRVKHRDLLHTKWEFQAVVPSNYRHGHWNTVFKKDSKHGQLGKCHDGWGWKSSHIMWPCACLGELDGWHS